MGYLSSTFAGAHVELRRLARLKYLYGGGSNLGGCRVQVAAVDHGVGVATRSRSGSNNLSPA
jgi:hypothetical protein